MTSKISFLKLVREDLRKRSWVLVLLAVLFFLAYPAAVLLNLDSIMSGDWGAAIADRDQEIHRFLENCLGYGNTFHFLLTGLAAVIVGTVQFSYLHSKEKLDLYYSLPVRRKTMFMSSYLAGLVSWVLIFLVCQVLCLIVIISKGLLYAGLPGLIARAAVFRIVMFLFLYNIMIFAMQFTGKTVLAVLGMGVLNAYGPALVLLLFVLMEKGFYTATNLNFDWYGSTSPVILLYNLQNKLNYRQPFPVEAALVLVGVAGVFLLNLWLCTHRKTEHAGMALAFPKVEQILKFLLVLPGAVYVGLVADEMAGTGRNFWLYAGFLFGVVVLSILMEFIYHRDLKMVLRHRVGLGVTILVGVLTMSAFVFDWFGYNTWLPKKEELHAMSVCMMDGIGGMVYETHYPVKEEGGVDYSTGEYTGGYERIIKASTESFDEIYSLAQSAVESGNVESGWQMTVRFILKNGREKYRIYAIESDTVEAVEEKLYRQEWYRRAAFPLLSDEDWEEKLERIELYESYETGGEGKTLVGQEAKDFLRVYREELSKMSVSDLMGEDAVPDQNGEMRYINMDFIFREDRDTYCQASGYPLTSKFKKTLEKLEWQDLKG